MAVVSFRSLVTIVRSVTYCKVVRGSCLAIEMTKKENKIALADCLQSLVLTIKGLSEEEPHGASEGHSYGECAPEQATTLSLH